MGGIMQQRWETPSLPLWGGLLAASAVSPITSVGLGLQLWGDR